MILTEVEIWKVFFNYYPDVSPFSPGKIPESYKQVAQAQIDKLKRLGWTEPREVNDD